MSKSAITRSLNRCHDEAERKRLLQYWRYQILALNERRRNAAARLAVIERQLWDYELAVDKLIKKEFEG